MKQGTLNLSPKNHLNLERKIKLSDWLKSIGDAAKDKPAETLANLATESLGFPVSMGNVQGIRKALGLAPGQGKCQRVAKSCKLSAATLHDLALSVHGAQKALAALATAVREAEAHVAQIDILLEDAK